jgi:hypothetical protein
MPWIDDVKAFLSLLESLSLLGSRQQHAVLLMPVVKENICMIMTFKFHAS